MLFYLGFPQYENEEFWAYIDRLVQFLDSLDNHDFSEEELRLTIEKGMNSQVKSFLDSLCDGDLSSKSDDEAYNLFDWLNRESRKPNFSLSSIEENTIEDVGEEFVGVSEGVVEIEECEDILEERLEIEVERPFEQVEVETPFFEDEPYTIFEDIHTTSPTPLATSADNEDALFEDYESKSDEESIMFEDLEVKWDDEPLGGEVLLEGGDFEVDFIEDPIFKRFDAPILVIDEHLKPVDFIDFISLDPLLEVMYVEEESVSFDSERDCEVHLLDEPIYEKFEVPFCGGDEFIMPTDDLDLISYAPLLEIIYVDDEYNAPLFDYACMGESVETPLLDKFDDCDVFLPSIFEKFVFEIEGWKDEVECKEAYQVSYIVNCPMIVPFDHPPPIKEEGMFYIVEFELDEENDQIEEKWKILKDLNSFDKVKAMSGLAHRLWDPG
ncbi:uncharacterized protein LOC141596424 [Silene latifolia]|uniref:uncharacterized protein LOC141596424 n=1 Tax=Silene latifolia TaxID=37657 RepID=UPI003D780A4E